MKYKVGDVVRLKSAEELIDLGFDYNFAEHYAGKEFPIINMTKDKIRLEVSENWLDIKIIEGMDDRYTFDELKAKVDEFREYIVCFEKKNFCMIDIGFTTSKTMIEAYNKYVVETNINIF